MCGISGIVPKRNGIPSISLIRKMNHAIAHRGPDGDGFLSWNGQKALCAFDEIDPGAAHRLPYSPSMHLGTLQGSPVVLGHRRLAIIDTGVGGHQPMCDTAQCLWITYNGELYNYIELRKELEQKGHHFQSHSDTEVILNAYREWGADCLHHFDGMWSFCILDLNTNSCFASRDRLGVKPFYFVINDQLFAFASEQKAFIEAGILKAAIDEKALHRYLVYNELEQTPNNFFSGVTELWPGHWLRYDLQTHELSNQKYFDATELVNHENDNNSVEILIEKTRQLVTGAIGRRLRSDVEVGTCLSGGLDSSIIATVMAAQTPHPIHCFTAAFKNSEVSELAYATAVAKATGANHHVAFPDPEEMLAQLDQLIYGQDVPIWDTSTYAQYSVMKLAHENKIKVVLDGQGADELFAGYHHHYFAMWCQLATQHQWKRLVKEINASGKTISSPWKFFAGQLLKSRMNADLRSSAKYLDSSFVDAYHSRIIPDNSELNNRLIQDIRFARLKTFLRCEDRCGMIHSVESRTPFSDDPALLHFAFSFPGEKKIHEGKSKYLLREAFKDALPATIANRFDKKGFETPMSSWLLQLREKMEPSILEAGFNFISDASVRKLDLTHSRQATLFFKLYVLSRWQRMFAKEH